MRGRFGAFGGQYVPETLMGALNELEDVWHEAKADPLFQLELAGHRHAFIGRPTPLYAAERLGAHFGGAHIHFKREDLCHTGAHKLNNAVGQALLAIRMGKKRIIAETGAGQHGVAVATVCARFGLECAVYMGTEDMRRQSMNVRRMKLLGADVKEVASGTRTLKDATSEAIRDWVTNVRTTHYIIGSVVGPHPYPEMVRDLQRVIGDEAREQYLSVDGKLPDVVVACVGGGSNAIGIFTAFLDDKDVSLVPLGLCGSGLSRGRSGAFVPARRGACRLCGRRRQGRGGGVQALHPARGHHAGARARARAAPRRRDRARARPRRAHPHLPFGARGQGHGFGRKRHEVRGFAVTSRGPL